MWGNTKEATDLLLHTHVLLADRLSGDKWKRVQIWRGHTSVHEWGFGSRYFAFDIVPSVKHTSVTLISRDVDAIDLLKEGLKCEGVSFKTVDKRPERLLIRVFHHPDNPPPVGEIVSLVQAVRKAVELSVVDFRSWLDPDTSISIPYAVKPQRKSCSELVFLFSSIRSKPHWLDLRVLSERVWPLTGRGLSLCTTILLLPTLITWRSMEVPISGRPLFGL